MLDDLRKGGKDDLFDDEDDEIELESDESSGGGRDTLIFGLTAVERMMLSILLFVLVVVLGVALLLATNRIAIGG